MEMSLKRIATVLDEAIDRPNLAITLATFTIGAGMGNYIYEKKGSLDEILGHAEIVGGVLANTGFMGIRGFYMMSSGERPEGGAFSYRSVSQAVFNIGALVGYGLSMASDVARTIG